MLFFIILRKDGEAQSSIPGSPMYIWEQKLKLVKNILKEIISKLVEIQSMIEVKEIKSQLQEEEMNLQNKFNQVMHSEEEHWQLKSKTLRLKSRDQNTSFFISS